jgi:hypothetical protein
VGDFEKSPTPQNFHGIKEKENGDVCASFLRLGQDDEACTLTDGLSKK